MKTRLRRGLYAPELLEARIAPATFIVDSLLDNGLDGTLRKEIMDANAMPGADTIIFKIPAMVLPGAIVLGGTEIPITEPLTIKGPGIDLLTVSGNDLSRIFNINYAAASLKPTTISGLTLTNGKATVGDGGAILSDEPLSLDNVVVRNSSAADEGGGVFVNTAAGKISIKNSRIVHNSAFDSAGGLYLQGPSISVVKTTIANNTAQEFGGMLAFGLGAKASVVIDSCVISNNVATNGPGGGVYLNGPDDGKISIKNTLITRNNATGGGGGLFIEEGNLSISKTTFSGNVAGVGGAIRNDDAMSLTISGSRFLANAATLGASQGGGALYLNGPSEVKISGSLFAGNSSASYGGAIVTVSSPANVTVTGSSFLGNTSTMPGGAILLDAGSVLTMKSSIISGNVAGGAGGAILAKDAAMLNLTGNKFTENRTPGSGGALFLQGAGAMAVTANLKGNLFQANAADYGGAVFAQDDSVFNSNGDKFIGNVAIGGQGGGVYLDNAGGIVITGSLFQSNVAGGSGGGIRIDGAAVLTSIKVLDNVAGSGGRGGGLRLLGGPITLSKSVITGNVANDGGGIFYDIGSATIDAATIAKTKGNAALFSPNIGSA